MRYALTFTSDPNAYDWGDTDTIIVETDTPQGEGGSRWYGYPKAIEEILIKYGRSPEDAKTIAKSDYWFVRSVDEVDVAIDFNNQVW